MEEAESPGRKKVGSGIDLQTMASTAHETIVMVCNFVPGHNAETVDEGAWTRGWLLNMIVDGEPMVEEEEMVRFQ